MKQWMTVFALGFAVFGIAQEAGRGDVLAVTHGKVGMLSRDGRRAQADFEVVKVKTEKGDVVVRGRFRFEQPATDKTPKTVIEMGPFANLGVDGTKARFGGRAVLIVHTQNGPRKVNGEAVVNVNDLKHPNETKEIKDVLEIHFKAKETDLTFDFGGAVQRGDLVVREKKA
ncbi:MAG: hypothetical protein JST40_00290 [Armatimonadetes bacterium]|nr:hypothetical protein [Armatimonadota bacterium]